MNTRLLEIVQRLVAHYRHAVPDYLLILQLFFYSFFDNPDPRGPLSFSSRSYTIGIVLAHIFQLLIIKLTNFIRMDIMYHGKAETALYPG